MDDYEIELSPEVVVDWIDEAVKQGGAGLLTTAWREYTVDEGFRPEKGGYEETDVGEVVAVGSLEVMPEHRPESWILRVRVEDELGDRLPPDEEVPEGPEEIHLDEFVEAFINPRHGTATVWVSAVSPADKEAFDRFLSDLERSAGGGKRR